MSIHQEVLQVPIHETFQSTVQGEGFWIGTLVDFIRLSGCPVRCSWCDTGYSDGGVNAPREMKSFTELLKELKSPRVVISGGEPFIHKQLPQMVQALLDTDRQVNIETSGAFWQEIPSSAWITLSPKQHISPTYPVKELFWERANEIKFVISTGQELEFYKDYLTTVQDRPIFLQPEWNVRDRAVSIILELLQQNPNYRLSLQTHKYIGVA
ncbi:7-carboxy-7-deazaguanine synthase QueE [Pseudanabaena sp. lw0831]|uniref:7-carboxy-7-deazaguanine synthase QueE n=1 Tax=Pseudanabaena sp. lw0831 TaxID=1357935 RepID=UPI001915ABE2|nr:7-carboxy-7-deazaguanine synthase QueE [Pseudanabaena sp. lw0831]